MATLQEMLSKKIAENKAESLAKTTTPVAPKAPVVSSPTVNPTSTVEKPADFINFEQAKPVSETKAPVPTSITQWVTPKVSVTTPWISEPTKVTPPTTTPKVIWEENWQPIYERKTNTNTTTTPWVTWTDLNLPTAKWTLESPTYSFDVKDPNNYMGTGMTLEQFKTLPLETQSAYTNAALANEQQKQWLIKQVEYATDVTKQKELMEKQRAIKVQTDQLSSENQAIQDNQQVAKARQDLDTLKQNIGFLGQWWRPVQSQQVIDSYDRMLTTSEQQFQDMVKIQNNMKQMRELGIQFDTNAYQAQLDQIHTELKRNVDSVIQDAINGFSADQMSGMIDSPESLQKLQDKYNSMIDQSVMGLTNKSIANLQTMQEVYKGKIATAQQEYQAYQESMAQYQKQQAEQQATFIKNENTLNKDMSEALWYYVNANWKPLMTTEGTTIAVKKDMPAPIFDRESGVMVTFEPDAKGNPVWITKQIMQPSQSAQLEQQYKMLQMQKMQQEMNTSDKTQTVKNADWSETVKQYNVNTGRYDIDVTGSSPLSQNISDPVTMQQIAEFCTSNRWRDTVQCWELVNDYIKMATGTKGWLGNSFNDKVKAIENMGRSPSPVEWWVFAFDVKTSQGNTGHTGIVTKVNDDGSIEVLEANRKENSAKWWVPTTGTYRADQIGNMVFSIPPKTKEAQAELENKSDPSKFPQYVNYIENGKLPVWMKDWTPQAETFRKQALDWYVANKEQELNGLWLTISNPTAFSSVATNAPKMKAINEALAVVPSFTNTMDQLIALTDEYGTELIPWNAKNQMNMLVKDAQLQAKEIYNLWVLNWPDLSLMEAIIANPASITAKWEQLFGVSFKKSLENAKKKIMDNAYEKAKSIWLSPLSQSTKTIVPVTQQQTTTPPATQQEQNYTPVELQARDNFNW